MDVLSRHTRAGPRALRGLLPACLLLLTFVSAPALGQSSPGTPRGPSSGESDAESADSGTRWLPENGAFAPLLASPSEVQLGGFLLFADRPDIEDFEGANLEARVTLGHQLHVLRVRSEDDRAPSVQLGFEVGIASRFSLATPQADLINTDFRVGLPISLGYGTWKARFTLLHISSHFGDEFVYRFPRPVLSQVSRDGFELVVARELDGGVRVYAGGDYNFHANRTVERTSARGGVEWNPAPVRAGETTERVRAWPYAGANLQTTSLTDRIAGTGIVGLGIRARGLTLRLEALAHAGPSPMGRLRTAHEQFVGFGLRVEP